MKDFKKEREQLLNEIRNLQRELKVLRDANEFSSEQRRRLEERLRQKNDEIDALLKRIEVVEIENAQKQTTLKHDPLLSLPTAQKFQSYTPQREHIPMRQPEFTPSATPKGTAVTEMLFEGQQAIVSAELERLAEGLRKTCKAKINKQNEQLARIAQQVGVLGD